MNSLHAAKWRSLIPYLQRLTQSPRTRTTKKSYFDICGVRAKLTDMVTAKFIDIHM